MNLMEFFSGWLARKTDAEITYGEEWVRAHHPAFDEHCRIMAQIHDEEDARGQPYEFMELQHRYAEGLK